MKYKVAFVGNPNVGKSAWINALSNAHFKVGNWPGVTVEKKEAYVEWEKESYHLIDLPGTHSLLKTNNEENITAQYLKKENIDLIVNVVDATNLAKNLFLTLCLRELQIPMILIFNFMDEVEKFHIRMDMDKIAKRLQIDIYPYSAFDRSHIEDVKKAITTHVRVLKLFHPLLSNEEEVCYVKAYNYLESHTKGVNEQFLHRLLMMYLREDSLASQQFLAWDIDLYTLEELCKGMNTNTIELNYYKCVDTLMNYVHEDTKKKNALTTRIDRIFLHKIFGLPIFLFLFTLLLLFVFSVSSPYNAFISYLFNDVFVRYASVLLEWSGEMFQAFVIDGVLAGIGGVLSFVPLMTLLYFMLALLEESGYMARISFLLDRVMRIFQMSGKSFVSLLMGFGCNVPAIYATRTLDNEKQKRLTAILVPFMSCGARLPVYVLFASAFFPHQAGVMILCVYGLGLLFALLFALLLSHISYMHEDALFIQELPLYRMPRMRQVTHKVKEEVKNYVKKAFGIVLWAMIILWGLSYFPSGDIENSYIAQGAKAIQPLFEPLGFGTRWESIASLPGGILAKETIVGYFEQVLNTKQEKQNLEIDPRKDVLEIGNHALNAVLESGKAMIIPQVSLVSTSTQQVQGIHSLWKGREAKLRAFCFMVYVLLSIPCIMTLQALYHEYGWKLMMLSIVVMTIVPYLCALFLFQIVSILL